MPRLSDEATARVNALPAGVPLLRTSERSAWKRCPQRWWWSYREGLVVPHDEDPNALWFGIGIHEALAHWYGPGKTRRNDFIEKWDAYADDSMRHIATTADGSWDDKEWIDAKDLGHAMLTGYLKRWGTDQSWDVIYTEEPFEIEIPALDERGRQTDDTEAIFVSTFDGVYRDRSTRKIYLMEHKTAAVISDAHLPMDDQAGAYWAVATNVLRSKGILGAKERIHGIHYNYLRKSMPDDKPRDAQGYVTNKPTKEHFLLAISKYAQENPWFEEDITDRTTLPKLQDVAERYNLRVLGDRSKIQPKPLFERFLIERRPRERAEQIRRISREAAIMNAQRRGELPIWKTPTKDCGWQCPFYNMCDLHERGEDITEFKRLAFTVRDPYADRRKSAGE